MSDFEESEKREMGCHYLRSNRSFIIKNTPGWETIPDTIVINICLCTVLILIFIFLRWRVRQTRAHTGINNQINLLHFIYGDHRQTDFTDRVTHKTEKKLINRKHRLAYLPIILHAYSNAIKKSQMPTKPREKSVLSIQKSKPNEEDQAVVDSAVEKFFEDSTSEDSDSKALYTEDSAKSDSERQTQENTDKETDEQNKQKTIDENELKKIKEKDAEKQSKSDESVLEKLKDKYWILNFFIIKDKEIVEYKGSDALQYLLFQRYIIYFMFALTIFCLMIILPVNLQGDAVPSHEHFSRTTINNIDKESRLFWVHILITITIIAMGVYMMYHFSRVINVDMQRVDQRILLIQNIPQSARKLEILLEFFHKTYPNIIIKRIHFIYDIRELWSLEKNRKIAIEAKRFCVDYKKLYGQRCEVRPYCLGTFGGLCGCCSCCPKLDGIQFYSEERAELEKNIRKEVKKLIADPKESAFVVFKDKSMAYQVYHEFRKQRKPLACCNCCVTLWRWCFRGISSIFTSKYKNDALKTYQWKVFYAPYPEDVEWKDIAIEYKSGFYWSMFMNLILLFIFFFLSTPAMALHLIDKILFKEVTDSSVKSIIVYLQPLITILMTILLPGIIILASNQVPYRTISALNHAIMWKVYVFLLLMVLILPSLGFLSVDAALDKFFREHNSTSTFTDCLFPPESGAFFTNYVLAAAFLANSFDLLRVPELLLYLLCTVFISRSVAERESARQKVSFEFTFGSKYPRFLLVFTIVVTFSVACPLIAPCGLLYMIGKHLVDRYSIFYVYFPSKINSRIHSTAVLYVHISLVFLMIQVFTVLEYKASEGPKYLASFAIFVSVIALLCHTCFHCCKDNEE